MLSQVIATNQGTHLYSISLPQFSIRTLDLISFNIFSPFPGYFLYLQIHNHQRTSPKLLLLISVDSFLRHHKSASVLFNVHKSLIKDWGPESVGALPEETMQQLLTEVGYLSDTSAIQFF